MPARIIRPPMVGVPALRKWVCGPSARIGWPLPWRTFSDAMIRGPNRNTISAAVNIAPPVRKVIYLKRLKNWTLSARSTNQMSMSSVPAPFNLECCCQTAPDSCQAMP
jgi:hypothetical protein